jgi:hypothetical protein
VDDQPITDLPGVTSRPDFSGVTTTADTTEQRTGRLSEAEWQAEGDRLAGEDPLEGTGWYQRYLAGVAKSGLDTGRGLKQFAVDAMGELAGDRTGITDGDNQVTQWAARTGEKLRREQAQNRKDEEPITNSWAGLGGNVAGTLGQVFIPGAVFRGTTAGAAALPTSLAGNALQGLAVGAVQPVAGEGERIQNALIGLGGGLGGAAAAKTLSAATRVGGNALSAVLGRPTTSSAERAAAQIIAQEAGGIDGLLTAQPSNISGVQRTFAEETLNPGIARLERQVRGQTNTFDPIDRANNAARVQAIEQFAGDPTKLSAAERARSQASKPLLAQSYLDSGVNVDAVRNSLAQQIKDNATRPSVQSALTDVQRALDNAGDDVYSLYGVRKYIGDLLGGKAGGDKTYARAASKELKAFQETLDQELAAKSPTFAAYLQSYRQGSEPINRMQVGQQLLQPDSGGAVLDPQTGAQVLTPASFSRKARNLDQVAAKATGFGKAKASQILQPADLATIRSIQDDLERQAFRATAGSGGNSMTQERQALARRIGRGAVQSIPVVGKFSEALEAAGEKRINDRLAYLLSNPAEARRVLESLEGADRETLSKALLQLSARTGASAPALAE